MAYTYLKAALLTLAITLVGFLFISQLDAMRAAELRQNVDDLLFQSQSERLVFLYSQAMANDSKELCSYLSSATPIKASRAYQLAEKIGAYEKSNVVSEEYERIKGQYYLANLELYVNLRAAAKYCPAIKDETILFFYKVKQDCADCRAQGAALDQLRSKRPNLRVFAVPSDSDYEFINLFARRHSITTVPSLVINDQEVLPGFRSSQEIASVLDRQKAS